MTFSFYFVDSFLFLFFSQISLPLTLSNMSVSYHMHVWKKRHAGDCKLRPNDKPFVKLVQYLIQSGSIFIEVKSFLLIWHQNLQGSFECTTIFTPMEKIPRATCMLHLEFEYQPIVMRYEHSLSSTMGSEQLISIFLLLIPIFASICAFWFHLILEAEILKHLRGNHTDLSGNTTIIFFFLKFQNCMPKKLGNVYSLKYFPEPELPNSLILTNWNNIR